eukprot:scaffold69872_cov72-Phaeocystis_antarctica.AAC.4
MEIELRPAEGAAARCAAAPRASRDGRVDRRRGRARGSARGVGVAASRSRCRARAPQADEGGPADPTAPGACATARAVGAVGAVDFVGTGVARHNEVQPSGPAARSTAQEHVRR